MVENYDTLFVWEDTLAQIEKSEFMGYIEYGCPLVSGMEVEFRLQNSPHQNEPVRGIVQIGPVAKGFITVKEAANSRNPYHHRNISINFGEQSALVELLIGELKEKNKRCQE